MFLFVFTINRLTVLFSLVVLQITIPFLTSFSFKYVFLYRCIWYFICSCILMTYDLYTLIIKYVQIYKQIKTPDIQTTCFELFYEAKKITQEKWNWKKNNLLTVMSNINKYVHNHFDKIRLSWCVYSKRDIESMRQFLKTCH